MVAIIAAALAVPTSAVTLDSELLLESVPGSSDELVLAAMPALPTGTAIVSSVPSLVALAAASVSAAAPPALPPAEAVRAPLPSDATSASGPADQPQSTRDKIKAGIRSSFAFPIAELYVRKHESSARDLLDGLTITPGLQLPFSARSIGAGNTGASLSGSPALTLDLRYRPVGYWFAQVQLLAYLQPSKRAPWNGDFFYSFGYDDYHPYTFSLVYSNYAESRFDPRPGNPLTRLARGTISLGWKAPLPEQWGKASLFDDRLTIDCRVGLNVSPQYDRDDGGVGDWKQSANLGCRYPFTQLLFVDLNLFAYGRGQQPWDPDFTYSFGLADYRSGRFSILYANYSGNRFPGRRRAANTGMFRDGGLFITWNRQF